MMKIKDMFNNSWFTNVANILQVAVEALKETCYVNNLW